MSESNSTPVMRGATRLFESTGRTSSRQHDSPSKASMSSRSGKYSYAEVSPNKQMFDKPATKVPKLTNYADKRREQRLAKILKSDNPHEQSLTPLPDLDNESSPQKMLDDIEDLRTRIRNKKKLNAAKKEQLEELEKEIVSKMEEYETETEQVSQVKQDLLNRIAEREEANARLKEESGRVYVASNPETLESLKDTKKFSSELKEETYVRFNEFMENCAPDVEELQNIAREQALTLNQNLVNRQNQLNKELEKEFVNISPFISKYA